MSCLFESFLKTIPENRSELVNDLEIPDDITVSQFRVELSIPVEDDDESLETVTDSCDGSVRSDSSLALSRAMTDSEIDYGRYKRMKNRKHSNPWDEMHDVITKFPAEYLSSLTTFQTPPSDPPTEEFRPSETYRNDDFRASMEKFFEEECKVFDADDPGLLELHEAFSDLKIDFGDVVTRPVCWEPLPQVRY